jgi:hypothetical protein
MTRWRWVCSDERCSGTVRDEFGDVLQELSGNLTEDGE